MSGYDLCSSRHCNVCLLLQSRRQQESAATTTTASTVSTSATTTNPSLLLVPTRLQKCNGCQLVLYCGAEHQKLDHPLHRDLCNATRKIMSAYQVRHPFLLNGAPTCAAQMERTTLQLKYLLRTLLARPLRYYEEELSSFPEHCAICFAFLKVKLCRLCRAVSYCSEKHAHADLVRHSRVCGHLQLVYSPFKVQAVPPDVIADFYRRVPDLHKTDLVAAFERATLKRLPVMPTASLSSYQLFASAADFSCIGTICYALGFVEMRNYDNSKFVIFILGASLEQDLWFRSIHTKFFFLQHPQISRLELYFIGPEAVVEECAKKMEVYQFQGLERSILYTSYPRPFEQFCTEFNIQPSLIIAYNCGFSEHTYRNNASANVNAENSKSHDLVKDCWAPGLRQLVQTFDLPIVFTSFTQLEAEFDYGALLRIAKTDELAVHVERIFNVKQNPYRDLRPLRNWHQSDKEDIYYRNGYVQAVRTSLEF